MMRPVGQRAERHDSERSPASAEPECREADRIEPVRQDLLMMQRTAGNRAARALADSRPRRPAPVQVQAKPAGGDSGAPTLKEIIDDEFEADLKRLVDKAVENNAADPAGSAAAAAPGTQQQSPEPSSGPYDLPEPPGRDQLTDGIEAGAAFGGDPKVAEFARAVAAKEADLAAPKEAERGVLGATATQLLTPAKEGEQQPVLKPEDRKTFLARINDVSLAARQPFVDRALAAARAAKVSKGNVGKAAAEAVPSTDPVSPGRPLSEKEEKELRKVAEAAVTAALQRAAMRKDGVPIGSETSLAARLREAHAQGMKGAPPELVEAKLKDLDSHFKATVNHPRFAKDSRKKLKHGWMVGVRERFQYEKTGKNMTWEGSKSVPTDGTWADIPASVLRPGTTLPKVLDYVADFLSKLKSAWPRFNVSNYSQGPHAKGYAVDVYLLDDKERDARTDVRGFWSPELATDFLAAVESKAKEKNVRWSALYNDFETTSAFPGKAGYQGKEGNWHGPLVLHIHLEIYPGAGDTASGSPAGKQAGTIQEATPETAAAGSKGGK